MDRPLPAPLVLRSIMLPTDLDNWLKERAFNLTISKSELIREILWAAKKARGTFHG